MQLARRTTTTICAALAAVAGLAWSGYLPRSASDFVSRAEARIGRPLTPMSYAGVARRTTRRAVAVGAREPQRQGPTTTISARAACRS